MIARCLFEPAFLMKLGGDPELGNDSNLGQAVAHVISQPRDDHWLFDIITKDGLITSSTILEIALTPAFAHWEKSNP
jgi:hypothetical protein